MRLPLCSSPPFAGANVSLAGAAVRRISSKFFMKLLLIWKYDALDEIKP